MASKLYKKPSSVAYWFLTMICRILSIFVFKRKILRNELKGVDGPFVLLGNHECALDCANTAGISKKAMTYIVSFAFYNTLPVRGLLKAVGVIVKQQFHTEISDMKRMKAVIDNGRGLMLYPSGLMSENGLSTPIVVGTAQLLKWLGADVYVARTYGSYHVMPKWSSKLRPGRTYMDIYKLFPKEELEGLSKAEVKDSLENALDFDAYREQERFQAHYKNGDNLEGLENVLYRCPKCKEKYSIKATGNKIGCINCGFERFANDTCLFEGEEYRYASDWSREIYNLLLKEIGEDFSLSFPCEVHTINFKKHKFEFAGNGTVSINNKNISLTADLCGEAVEITESIGKLPYLPFKPGKCFDLQSSNQSYRIFPPDGRTVTELVQTINILYNRTKTK